GRRDRRPGGAPVATGRPGRRRDLAGGRRAGAGAARGRRLDVAAQARHAPPTGVRGAAAAPRLQVSATRFALGVEYDGGGFSGWQRLDRPDGPKRRREATVQAKLEAALSFVAGHRVDTTCAGRTDAGVHAACQVVHFDSDAARDPRSWMLGATSRLPPEVCVRWCVPVADDFNARFSAVARRYRYRILNRPVRPADRKSVAQ